jgi:hypothetical protein
MAVAVPGLDTVDKTKGKVALITGITGQVKRYN